MKENFSLTSYYLDPVNESFFFPTGIYYSFFTLNNTPSIVFFFLDKNVIHNYCQIVSGYFRIIELKVRYLSNR